MGFLKEGEIVLFTGNYNLSNGNVSGNLDTLSVTIDKIPNSFNILVAQSNAVNLKNSTNIYLLENYTLSSYKSNNSKKIGQISWNGLYPNGQTIFTTLPSIQKFIVLGNNGIFKNVTSVVIDFNNPDRVIYFVGYCKNIIQTSKDMIFNTLKNYQL